MVRNVLTFAAATTLLGARKGRLPSGARLSVRSMRGVPATRAVVAVCALFLSAVGGWFAGSAPADAQSGAAAPSAPVIIASCSGGITSVELVEIATYDVVLRNTSRVPADEIRLSARYGRHEKRATFDLKEVFPPGADVSRHLRRTVNGGLFSYWSDHNDCFVDYVHFTNGTSWTRPAR